MQYLCMATTDQTGATLAILIDADNANPAIVKGLIDEVAKFGRATVRRIYGDWTTPNLGPWKSVLLEHSITPVQQFAYTKGKNATDSTMIIDAMDLLYADNVEGFCLVSSDSDFTRLASRLKESGKHVYGFGEKKTPQPFVAACDRFIYTEVFTQSQGDASRRRSTAELQRNKDLVGLLGSAIDAASDDSGWAHLGVVGSNLTKQAPDFDSRTYGYSKLSDLLDAAKLFEVERQDKAIRVRRTAPRR
jgi:uncharacterized LabA/DUF88 family protein